MAGFQREVRTTVRSQAEIDAERNDKRRSAGLHAFVNAPNAPGRGEYRYAAMLESLN